MDKEALVQVKNLSKSFRVNGKIVQAVSDVSFTISAGETLGLVGESGCGKSTLGRAILLLEEPTAGEVTYDGQSLTHCSEKNLKTLRKKMQMIFQDPYASLNPRMTAGEIIAEPLDIHHLGKSRQREERVEELLRLVGLSPSVKSRFPHEFSGGQRQRIGIARSLAVRPDFIVCDEAISALDVSVQAQIVNLLKKLQQEMGLTYLFIAHDLNMVKYLSDRVAVMYLGHLMELASSDVLYANPLHPYTQALLSAIPIPDPIKERKRARIVLEGEIPNPISPPPGCVFCTRCPLAQDICRLERPLWKESAPQHFTACHFV